MRGIAALLPLVLGISGSVLKTPTDLGCDEGLVSVSGSPDSRWQASVMYYLCGGPLAREYVDRVMIEDPELWGSEGIKVLALEGNYRQARDIVVEWKSNKLLRITVPNTTVIGLQRKRFQDIEIEVRFDPDDPAARARYLDQRFKYVPFEIPDRRAR